MFCQEYLHKHEEWTIKTFQIAAYFPDSPWNRQIFFISVTDSAKFILHYQLQTWSSLLLVEGLPEHGSLSIDSRSGLNANFTHRILLNLSIREYSIFKKPHTHSLWIQWSNSTKDQSLISRCRMSNPSANFMFMHAHYGPLRLFPNLHQICVTGFHDI